MVALSTLDKSRCRHHLKMGAGVPAGDRARLEEAMDDIPDTYTERKVKEQLDRCDRAEAKTELDSEPATSKEYYAGDINRTIVRSDTFAAGQRWRENYMYETDRLAHMLWAPNYNHDELARFRFERGGGAYIKSVPGPADTSIGTRLYLGATYG